MIEKKYIKQYDRGSPVRGALTSAEDGQPVDLTNATIKFLMMQINDDGTKVSISFESIRSNIGTLVFQE